MGKGLRTGPAGDEYLRHGKRIAQRNRSCDDCKKTWPITYTSRATENCHVHCYFGIGTSHGRVISIRRLPSSADRLTIFLQSSPKVQFPNIGSAQYTSYRHIAYGVLQGRIFNPDSRTGVHREKVRGETLSSKVIPSTGAAIVLLIYMLISPESQKSTTCSET